MSLQVAKLPQVVQQQATVANIQQMVSVSQQVGFVLVQSILLKVHLCGICCIFHLKCGIGAIFEAYSKSLL